MDADTETIRLRSPLTPRSESGVIPPMTTPVLKQPHSDDRPAIQIKPARTPTELLAPAGDLDSAYAAFHYSADAVYLGLSRFSARAEATNFNFDELSELVAFAHAATPRRRVFAAVNTLVLNQELAELVDSLAVLAETGTDAVIVQDLGVAHIVRKYLPGLALHGSTQMAVHSLAGAKTLKELGFNRVTLARELTLPEIRDIAKNSGLEVEVFIHGALCYSYSGLCLYSSLLRGKSGNRGRCAYPCRDLFGMTTTRGDAKGPQSGETCFAFSMKDLALAESVVDLRAAGVTSFKIEGRKKSSLYVATATAYYRGLLDSKMTPQTKSQAEADMQTVFSRPWTKLYLQSANNRDVADKDTVGHRGTPIGSVAAVLHPGTDWTRLSFITRRRIELHDGLQVDLPGGKPYGFAIHKLWVKDAGRGATERLVFEAGAGSQVEVQMPKDHPPMAAGTTIYCASSQHVKQKYGFDRPKPGLYKVRRPIDVVLIINAANVIATATSPRDSILKQSVHVETSLEGAFDPLRKPGPIEDQYREAFTKLGDTSFALRSFAVKNVDQRFVPVSILNKLRRQLADAMQLELVHSRSMAVTDIGTAICTPVTRSLPGTETLEWSLKVRRLQDLGKLSAADMVGLSEIILDITADPIAEFLPGLKDLSGIAGADKIRLALPIITRSWEQSAMDQKLNALLAAGWNRWEVGNLSGWTILEEMHKSLPHLKNPDLTTDWPIYVLNRAAALQVMALGASGFVLSPENSMDNITSLVSEFGGKAIVIVRQDTPLFISETCPQANMKGKCAAGKGATCREWTMDMRSGAGEKVTVVSRGCRAITIGERPIDLSQFAGRLADAGARRFRIDLMWRPRTPAEIVDIVHTVRCVQT